MTRWLYKHRPRAFQRRGYMYLCGHSYPDGMVCGRLVYWAQRPHFETGIWKHYPGEGERKRVAALPEGYEEVT
jgi:hypothetical protein